MSPIRLMAALARAYCALAAAAVVVVFRVPKCNSLSNMSITVPVAVATGQSAKMTCTYDLQSDPLYTVKWYKGRQEFFRYVPKELPHTRVFPWPGINVDVSQSGPNQVVLRDVQSYMTGKYRCEVSADAPSFHTKIVSSWMHVVCPPVGQPVLSLEKRHYTLGDTLKGNCTSPPSSPPSNVSWYLNDRWMNTSYGRPSPVSWQSEPLAPIDPSSVPFGPGTLAAVEAPVLSTTTVGLQLEVNSFKVGKMRIRCVAELYGVFKTSAETVLDEEKPRLASILGTFTTGSGAAPEPRRTVLIVIMVNVFWMS